MAAQPARPPRRRLRRALAVGAGLGVLALAAGGVALWTQRSALGARLVVEALARRGVPATVRVTRLDPRGADASLVVGPAGDPDLVVPHLRLDFAAWPPPGGGAPRIAALTLDRPHLKARWDGRRLTFGALQPLVDEALNARPGGPPGPDVTIRGGRLSLATATGPAEARGDARLRAGRLLSADLTATAAATAERGVSARDLAGHVVAHGDADRLKLRLELSAAALRAPGAALQAPRLRLDADLPYGRDPQTLLDGHVVADATLLAGGADTRGARLSRARLDARFDGVLDRGGEHVVGAADAALSAAQAAAGPTILREVQARIAATGLDAAAARRTLVARAPLAVQVSARSGETRVGAERVRLDALRLSGRGRAALRDGLRLEGDLGGAAHAALDAAAAARLAAGLAPAGWDDLRTALARNLAGAVVRAPRLQVASNGRGWRATLAAPATLATDAGARLTLAQAGWTGVGGAGRGRFSATLAGGGLPSARLVAPVVTAARGELRAAGFDASVAGSAGPLREARLALSGDLAIAKGAVTLRAARCLDLALASYLGEGGAPLAQNVSARLCPVAAPLFEARSGRWRLAASAPSLTLEAPAAKLALTQAAATLRLSGARGDWGGRVELASARLRDTSAPLRFEPLLTDGSVTLDRRGAEAQLALSLAAPRTALGPLHLVQRFDTGDGALTLQAPALAFAPDALQPAMILPALAPFGTEVRGEAAAALELTWGKAGAGGEARFRTSGLDLKSPAGPLKGLSTDLRFASLDPLTTAAGQRVHVRELQALLPLTDIDATVQLEPQALRLESARATLGGGRVSLEAMRAPLQPGATLAGVLHADGVRVAPLLDAVNLSRALKLDATLGGVLPFQLGPDGLRFSKGALAAEGPGRLTLVRSALTGVSTDGGPGGAAPSAAQDFAFQALEDLAFSALDAHVDSQPGGRLGVLFHIKGRHDPPVGRPARVSLLDILRGRAFDKTIPLPKGTEVDLTLDTSLNFDDLYKAWLGLGHAPPAATPGAGSAGVQPHGATPRP